jgi:hypothetical protein
MSPSFRDPAEDASLRFYYRGWRPTLLGRITTRLWAWAAGLGILPKIVTTLLVTDRQSGHLVGHVLAPVTFEGSDYIVSMLGDGSNWVQDLRASGGAAFLKHGRAKPVVLTEVPAAKRAPILKAWCQIATSGRQHLPVPHDAPIPAFEAIAADYPVFRLVAGQSAPPGP